MNGINNYKISESRELYCYECCQIGNGDPQYNATHVAFEYCRKVVFEGVSSVSEQMLHKIGLDLCTYFEKQGGTVGYEIVRNSEGKPACYGYDFCSDSCAINHTINSGKNILLSRGTFSNPEIKFIFDNELSNVFKYYLQRNC